MIDPNVVGERYKKLATWGLILIGAGVTYTIAQAILEGLILWGAVAVTLAVIANFAPAFGDWVKNKKVQAIMAVAAANPIETMKNLYAEKCDEFEHKEDAIRDFDVEFRNVSNMVDKLKAKYPDEAKQYVELRDKMAEGMEELEAEQRDVRQALIDYKHQIDKAEDIWNVAKAMNRALERTQSLKEAAFADIKNKVAFDTVNANLNRAFANLDRAVAKRKNLSVGVMPAQPEATKALPQPSEVIEGQVIQRAIPANLR